jgi:hypothetical protein
MNIGNIAVLAVKQVAFRTTEAYLRVANLCSEILMFK